MLARRRALSAVALGAAAVLLLPAQAAQAAAPGAPGIGDEYFPGYGNGGYDVSHYELRLRYDPATDALAGTATLTARPTSALTSFNLDFALDPTAVRVNGAPAAFTRTGSELRVTPAAALRVGKLTTIVVDYAGVPSAVEIDGLSPWVRTADGAIAVGEPEIAAWWYPSNDHPLDKATFDISVAVPQGTEVLSNGLLARTSTERGITRWNWRTTKPMATYLAFLAIGQYEINQDATPSGLPIITAYSDSLGEEAGSAKASIERTSEIVEFLSTRLGPYPFEAQGGVVPAAGLGFALENQTRPVYDPGFFRRGGNTYVVAHENAHQWFGDSVSVAKWRDIWLNEGWASYMEWLWSEQIGEGTAQEIFDWEYASRPAEDPFWQVTIGDPGAAGIFAGAVYDRGAMTAHLLRTTVGDEAFAAILTTWLRNKKYANATIEEFIALAEYVSGKELGALFTTWLFTPGKPALPGGTLAAAAPSRPKSISKIEEAHEHLHHR